jgi:deoxyribonuclease-2
MAQVGFRSAVLKWLLVLCFISLCAVVTASLQCKDENGHAVDWWFIHKLPLLKKSQVSPRGFGYYYADANTPLTLSPNKLDTFVKGAMGSTLDQYMDHVRPGWIAWSDQPPGTPLSNNGAHAKGVMAFDGVTGFLLRHSTPRFPLAASTGPYAGYPEYARIYGQTFLCVSYSMDILDQLAGQMLLNGVNVYDQHVPNTVASIYENIAALASPSPPVIKSPSFQYRSFLSLGGNNFTDFAKSKYCACELYTAIVAPSLQSDMAVLSWGRPLMGSGCRPATAYDVLDISGMVLDLPEGKISYNETKEHSKLGFVAKGDLICIGDINRMTSQASRGGGTTCFANPSLWQALGKQIGDWMTCSTRP